MNNYHVIIRGILWSKRRRQPPIRKLFNDFMLKQYSKLFKIKTVVFFYSTPWWKIIFERIANHYCIYRSRPLPPSKSHLALWGPSGKNSKLSVIWLISILQRTTTDPISCNSSYLHRFFSSSPIQTNTAFRIKSMAF